MDIVVADIPPKYGMLLSCSRGENLQGTLQKDMSYATIPIFGQNRRLYRETLIKHMLSSKNKPHKYPLYSFHSDLDSFILYSDGDSDAQFSKVENNSVEKEENPMQMITQNVETGPFWNMIFDI